MYGELTVPVRRLRNDERGAELDPIPYLHIAIAAIETKKKII